METWEGEWIVEMVRQLYAQGNKSCNKVYFQSSALSVPVRKKVVNGHVAATLTPDDYFDVIQPSLSTRILSLEEGAREDGET